MALRLIDAEGTELIASESTDGLNLKIRLGCDWLTFTVQPQDIPKLLNLGLKGDKEVPFITREAA